MDRGYRQPSVCRRAAIEMRAYPLPQSRVRLKWGEVTHEDGAARFQLPEVYRSAEHDGMAPRSLVGFEAPHIAR